MRRAVLLAADTPRRAAKWGAELEPSYQGLVVGDYFEAIDVFEAHCRELCAVLVHIRWGKGFAPRLLAELAGAAPKVARLVMVRWAREAIAGCFAVRSPRGGEVHWRTLTRELIDEATGRAPPHRLEQLRPDRSRYEPAPAPPAPLETMSPEQMAAELARLAALLDGRDRPSRRAPRRTREPQYGLVGPAPWLPAEPPPAVPTIPPAEPGEPPSGGAGGERLLDASPQGVVVGDAFESASEDVTAQARELLSGGGSDNNGHVNSRDKLGPEPAAAPPEASTHAPARQPDGVLKRSPRSPSERVPRLPVALLAEPGRRGRGFETWRAEALRRLAVRAGRLPAALSTREARQAEQLRRAAEHDARADLREQRRAERAEAERAKRAEQEQKRAARRARAERAAAEREVGATAQRRLQQERAAKRAVHFQRMAELAAARNAERAARRRRRAELEAAARAARAAAKAERAESRQHRAALEAAQRAEREADRQRRAERRAEREAALVAERAANRERRTELQAVRKADRAIAAERAAAARQTLAAAGAFLEAFEPTKPGRAPRPPTIDPSGDFDAPAPWDLPAAQDVPAELEPAAARAGLDPAPLPEPLPVPPCEGCGAPEATVRARLRDGRGGVQEDLLCGACFLEAARSRRLLGGAKRDD